MGHNEILIGRALKGRREKALLSVKFGALRSPDGGWTGFDGRPAAVKNFAAYSLIRSGSTTSTSIVLPGWTPKCLSRTPSAQSVSW